MSDNADMPLDPLPPARPHMDPDTGEPLDHPSARRPSAWALVVYYMAAGDFVKIGYVRNAVGVFARLRAIQTGCPLTVQLVAFEPGDPEIEVVRHCQFAAARVRQNGEWFHLTPELVAHIEAVKTATEGDA